MNWCVVRISLVAVFTVFLFAVILWIFEWGNTTLVELVGTSLLFGNLAGLMWYNVETREIKLTSQRQLKLSVKPYLAISLTESSEEMKVVNVGNGSAVNIVIDPTPLSKDLGKEESAIELRYPEILSICPGKEQRIRVKNVSRGKEIDFPFAAHLSTEYANHQFILVAHYYDILGVRHTQPVELGKGGPRAVFE